MAHASFEHRSCEASLDVLALHDKARVFHVIHIVKVSVAHLLVGGALQEPRLNTAELVQQ
jgi:hypothetical protein